ncbi:MAG: 4-hydroxythreonine-4-phosphate dehydrogenase PdxA [Bacteroidia bacterium]|nr:4-hydroxythreonine-4-phosphate dehydrogenase PdxA [Bacteroidia bacterium]
MDLPIIAISAGDVNGIGPEVILKAFDRSELFDVCIPVVYGPAAAFEWYAHRLGLQHIPVDAVRTPATAQQGRLNMVDLGSHFQAAEIGKPTPLSGKASLDAVRAAFDDVFAKRADALVTAPISKEAIGLAGSGYHGHTEMLADFCGCGDDVIMILSGNTMKVGLVTVHMPVSAIAPALTRQAVERTLRLGLRAMTTDFGVDNPRLAVLALNPHAGDGGYLGSEERDIIIPAIEAMRDEAGSIEGPFAADGFFSTHNKTLYDLIIAMYHDQGLIPFKMQAQGRGVNVSCGLPIVRTSPDHGTAYGIASHGLASAESMKEAVLAARRIALNRRQ